jgi:hypothetical protein
MAILATNCFVSSLCSRRLNSFTIEVKSGIFGFCFKVILLKSASTHKSMPATHASLHTREKVSNSVSSLSWISSTLDASVRLACLCTIVPSACKIPPPPDRPIENHLGLVVTPTQDYGFLFLLQLQLKCLPSRNGWHIESTTNSAKI